MILGAVNHREAIVAKLVLSLTRLSFPLVRFRHNPHARPSLIVRKFYFIFYFFTSGEICKDKTSITFKNEYFFINFYSAQR